MRFLISNEDGVYAPGLLALSEALSSATSLVGGGKANEQVSDYQMAANQIVKLLVETPILTTIKNLPYHVLNVNIPDVACADDIKGRKITSLGHSQIARPVHHMIDPRGREAYWLSLRKNQNKDQNKNQSKGQNEQSTDKVPEPLSPHSHISKDTTDLSTTEMTDDQAVAAGYISLSPVRLPHTPVAALEALSALGL